MMKVYHNAFLDFFRFPKEPVVIDNIVKLRIAILKEINVNITNVFFCYNYANEWDREYKVEMMYESEDESYKYYVCSIKISEIRTIYYFFTVEYIERLNDIDYKKKVFVEKVGDINSPEFNQAYVSSNNFYNISKWELLFYDNSKFADTRKVSEIYYSIFPDRFNRSFKYVPDKLVKGRVIHNDFNELPVYLPNRDGIVENNDFFLGNIAGIIEKLEYLKALNVTIIYINPIFYAKSNNRYDTLDYLQIDPYLGSEDDFYELCRLAHSYDMKVIIDFVPNHVSNMSEYSKKYSRGTCWWGISDLVEIDLNSPDVQNFFFNEVIYKWLDDTNGNCHKADGIRCDVADEYPLSFIYNLYSRVKAINKNKIVIFEVWEHASNKNVCGLRNYVQGNMCDGVMNYELKDAIFAFICFGNALYFTNVCKSQIQTYPKEARQNMMNIADTHDSIRLITNIGNRPYVQKGDFRNPDILAQDRKWQVDNMFMSKEEYDIAVEKLKLFVMVQYSVFGNPVIYYGTEVGMEGYLDPTNRRCHIFDKGDTKLLDFYQRIGTFRKNTSYLAYANMRFITIEDGFVVYERYTDNESLIIAVNVSDTKKSIKDFLNYNIVLCSGTVSNEYLQPYSAVYLEKIKEKRG